MYSDEQKAIINCEEKCLKVLAGPGSGKTHTMVGRIRHFVDDLGIHPSSIVAFTFTRRAGKELKERLSKFMDVSKIWVGTFHSVCLEIIQVNNPSARVISQQEAERIMEQTGKSIGMWDWKKNGWAGRVPVLEEERKNKTRLATAVDAQMRTANEYDYNLILLQGLEAIKSGVMKRVSAVIVDEAQDTDALQWEIAKEIQSRGTDCILTAVGDLRQNIYSWRSARPDIFRDLDAEELMLTETFRLTRPVSSAANCLISLNPEGGVKIRSQKNSTQEVEVSEQTASFNARLMLDMGVQEDDIAVLCRTNKQVSEVSDDLRGHGVRVQKKSRPFLGDVYTFLVAVSSKTSMTATLSLESMLEWHGVKLNRTDDIWMQLRMSQDSGIKSLGECLMKYGRGDRVKDVVDSIRGARLFAKHELDWWEKKYCGWRVERAVTDAAMTDEDDSSSGITICTIHQSKGLEWDNVIIPYLNQGTFPVKSVTKNIQLLEEERRLFFVAITRAAEKAVLCYDPLKPVSQFVTECSLPSRKVQSV